VIPPVLYKYQSADERSLQNLRESVLYFSSPLAFNDPFDCALSIFDSAPSEADMRAFHVRYRLRVPDPVEYDRRYGPPGAHNETFASEIRAGIAKGPPEGIAPAIGVACFTEQHDDLLMWSHYADGHRGFCLAFSTDALPFSRALQVRYSPVVPSLPAVRAIKPGVDEALVEALMLTKAEQWSYEREWRLIVKGGSQPVGYDRACLRGIYLGAAMPEARQRAVRDLVAGASTRVVAMERPADRFAVRPVVP
jgi:hypothetical protein